MMRRHLELFAALLTVFLLTGAYLLVAAVAPMGPSSPPLHWLGVIGFALMLATETLYSWRKAQRLARWGPTRVWLAVHIYTGIVGPYMVLLHTGFRFAGLAGITFWMTLAVVGSGFVGRYIYTAIPRSSAGDALDIESLDGTARQLDAQLDEWLLARSAVLRDLRAPMEASLPTVRRRRGTPAGAARRYRHQWEAALARLDEPLRQEALQLWALLQERQVAQQLMRRALLARRMLSIWHTAHVPLAVAMFAAALLHIVAAVFFA